MRKKSPAWESPALKPVLYLEEILFRVAVARSSVRTQERRCAEALYGRKRGLELLLIYLHLLGGLALAGLGPGERAD